MGPPPRTADPPFEAIDETRLASAVAASWAADTAYRGIGQPNTSEATLHRCVLLRDRVLAHRGLGEAS